MANWFEAPNDPSSNVPSTGGDREARAPRRSQLLLRVMLAGIVLLAGLAVAAPVTRVAEPGADAQCSAPASGHPEIGLLLPPGHPPIDGARARGRVVSALPPGHPPIDGSDRRLAPARPLNPVFEAPTTVDL
jgi:hypothetical protein